MEKSLIAGGMALQVIHQNDIDNFKAEKCNMKDQELQIVNLLKQLYSLLMLSQAFRTKVVVGSLFNCDWTAGLLTKEEGMTIQALVVTHAIFNQAFRSLLHLQG